MTKSILTIVLAAAVAVSGLGVALAAIDPSGLVPQFTTGHTAGDSPLAKTWTTGVQENETGSQMPVFAATASPGSFSAEGKGFDPLARRQENQAVGRPNATVIPGKELVSRADVDCRRGWAPPASCPSGARPHMVRGRYGLGLWHPPGDTRS